MYKHISILVVVMISGVINSMDPNRMWEAAVGCSYSEWCKKQQALADARKAATPVVHQAPTSLKQQDQQQVQQKARNS